MPIMKWIRYGAWSATAVLVFLSAAILLGWWQVDGPGRARLASDASQGLAEIGGDFTLTEHTGRAVTRADYLGKPAAVFFGFTHCPEVCPTTLLQLSNHLRALGSDGDALNVLFITVDPERDTPEQLALYLQSFDPRIRGLSGNPAQIDAALAAFKAYAKRIPSEGGYTMDHTASVYLVDAQGRFRSMIDYHEDEATALAKLRLLLSRR